MGNSSGPEQPDSSSSQGAVMHLDLSDSQGPLWGWEAMPVLLLLIFRPTTFCPHLSNNCFGLIYSFFCDPCEMYVTEQRCTELLSSAPRAHPPISDGAIIQGERTPEARPEEAR